MCKRYRIDNSKRTHHTALIDCDLLMKVYINLIDQKEPTLDFKNLDEVELKTSNEKIVYFKKVVKPSDEEKNKNYSFLKIHLKKNNFN